MFPSLDQARENRPGETRPEYHQEASSQEKKKGSGSLALFASPWMVHLAGLFHQFDLEVERRGFRPLLLDPSLHGRHAPQQVVEFVGRGRIPREMRASKTKSSTRHRRRPWRARRKTAGVDHRENHGIPLEPKNAHWSFTGGPL